MNKHTLTRKIDSREKKAVVHETPLTSSTNNRKPVERWTLLVNTFWMVIMDSVIRERDHFLEVLVRLYLRQKGPTAESTGPWTKDKFIKELPKRSFVSNIFLSPKLDRTHQRILNPENLKSFSFLTHITLTWTVKTSKSMCIYTEMLKLTATYRCRHGFTSVFYLDNILSVILRKVDQKRLQNNYTSGRVLIHRAKSFFSYSTR